MCPENSNEPMGLFFRSSFHSLTISSAVTPSFAAFLDAVTSAAVSAVWSSLSACLSPIRFACLIGQIDAGCRTAARALRGMVRRNSQEQTARDDRACHC